MDRSFIRINPTASESNNVGNLAEESDFSHAVLKFINKILMEEELDYENCEFQDSALQAVAKPFYDILRQKHPLRNRNSPCQSFTAQVIYPPCSTIKDARKFLPSKGRHTIDRVNKRLIPLKLDYKTREIRPEVEICKVDDSPHILRRRKNHPEAENEVNMRIHKQFVDCSDDLTELPQIFDKLLLSLGGDDESAEFAFEFESSQNRSGRRAWHQDRQCKGSVGEPMYRRKGVHKRDLVDLSSLLIDCAESVARNNHISANQLLIQIRRHCSPFGSGAERLAFYFANGLEARLAGTGNEVYASLTGRRPAASLVLKALRFFISTSPLMKISNFFATQTTLKVAEKATRLHIIDFGILFGFHWACLIQHLSTRPGGPPVLHITGIDFCQSGFRPTAKTEETGRRLANYCERFNVPFEFDAIAQKWETIRLEDLKISRNEVIIVNCLYRLRNLLDESVELSHSPKDAVLDLIKRINPDVFIHGVVNGAYDAPFFISRFKEALHYFSAVFDALEATASQEEEEERMIFEAKIYGKEILNVVACEGSKRIERPETYKQWKGRNVRAGFRQLPLNQEMMKMVRAQAKCYHKDFLVDEDSQWIIGGWKGRILYALSCWQVA